MQLKHNIVKLGCSITFAVSTGLTISLPAQAEWTNKESALAGVSTGAGLIAGGTAASGIGAPVGGAIAIGTGAFEIGWFTCAFLFDPPDTVNYNIPVNIDDFVIEFPDMLSLEPDAPLLLAEVTDTTLDQFDILVATSRAYLTSLDRYSGALILEEIDSANARLQESQLFLKQLRESSKKTQEAVLNYVQVVDDLFPTALDVEITKQNVINTTNEMAGGIYPEADQPAIDAWSITPEELTVYSDFAATAELSDVDDLFAILDPVNNNTTTLRDVLIYSANAVGSDHVPVPEPITGLIFAAGFGGAALKRAKDKSKKS